MTFSNLKVPILKPLVMIEASSNLEIRTFVVVICTKESFIGKYNHSMCPLFRPKLHPKSLGSC